MKKLIVFLIGALFLFGCGTGDDDGGDNGGQGTPDVDVKYLSKGYEDLFTQGLLHDIEIRISQAEWNGLIQDMKAYMKTGNYRSATFVYKGPAGEVTLENVGFRVKGNLSRVIPEDNAGTFHRAHFKVRFNHEFDLVEGSDTYELRKERRFGRLRAMNLRMPSPGPPNFDPTQIREKFSYDLFERAGAYTSKVGSARVTITIEGVQHYFGIYNLEEPIDKSFLSKRYTKDGNDGNLYKCIFGDSGPASLETVDGVNGSGNATMIFPERRIIGIKDWTKQFRPTYDLKTNEDEADHGVLLDFIHNLNTLDGPDLKTYLDGNFEVDRFLRYLAMNFLINRWDGYTTSGNNYFLYFHNDGKIEFMTVDHDSALNSVALFYDTETGIYEWANQANELASIISGVSLSYFNSVRDYGSPLTHKILDIAEYRTLYEGYLEEFIRPENKMFLYSEFEKSFDQLYALYSPHLENDIGEGETMVKLEAVRKFFYDKTKSVVDQLGLVEADYETKPPSLAAPGGVSASDATSSDSITVSWTAVAYADYYNVFRSDAADGTYVKVSDDITGVGFLDATTIPETAYYYKVQAFMNQGTESALSTAEAGATAYAGVRPPAGVTATDGLYSHLVVISWDSELNADFYRVYRSDTENGSYGLISGDAGGTYYSDKTTVVNTPYYYKVQAVINGGDLTDLSETAAVAGIARDSGAGPPAIISGVQISEGTYSLTEDKGTTTYVFNTDGTCTKTTPSTETAGMMNYYEGVWSYGPDGKELTIDITDDTSYAGQVVIHLVETWANAFTTEDGTLLNLYPVKKTVNDPDTLLGSYTGQINIHVTVTGFLEQDFVIPYDVVLNLTPDGKWDLLFDSDGTLSPSQGDQSNGLGADNTLILFNGDYYMPVTSWWPSVYERQ